MLGIAKRVWFGCAIAGPVVLASAGAQAQTLPNPMDFGAVYQQLAFEAADTDGDNRVDLGEFARDAAAAFSGLDANRDGKLTPNELQPHPAVSFSRVDGNKDGALTFDEVMAFKVNAFRAADKNQDDALSYDEMVEAVRTEVGR